jgi:glycosyltransferase involved in cell wall biosynthesis
MKELTIICASYLRYKTLPVLLHSFLAQTLQNFKLLVIHDAFDARMSEILSEFKSRYPDQIDFFFTDKRYNDYGHSLRELGIQKLDTEYFLITNDDNYYCPIFLETMFRALKESHADIVMCDMIHSHPNPGGRVQNSYRYFETYPQRRSVDIGCFISRSVFAKKVGFRDKTHDGDATFFEDILRVAGNPRIAKVGQALFVHN